MVALLLFPGAGLVGSVLFAMGRVRMSEAKLQDPDVYRPVAVALATYCQSDTEIFSHQLRGPMVPPEARAVGRAWGTAGTNGASLIFGGGFYHFGYRLEPDPARSRPGANAWRLSLAREGSDDKPLWRFELPATNAYPADDLVDRTIASFDEMIRHTPDNEGAHRGKIGVYLRMGRVEAARAACDDFLRVAPENWWANLVYALRLAQTESPEAGERHIRGWVERKPNFHRPLDLALYHQLRGDTKDVGRALLAAVPHDPRELEWHGSTVYFRVYPAAMQAFAAGEYEAALRLCDRMLEDDVCTPYYRDAFRDLRGAAERRLAGEPATVTWDERLPQFDPFEGIDVEMLVGGPLAGRGGRGP